MDAIKTYKQIKATVNHCELSRDGKQFTLDVGDIVMFNRRMRFFQKAILSGEKLILATGSCAENMDVRELTTVKRATYSLRALNSKVCSASQNEKPSACASAIRGEPSMGFYSDEMVKLAESGDAEAQCNLGWLYERGYGVSIGRLREDNIFDYKFVGLSHNTIRGAAGGGVLLAELLKAKGYIGAK